MQSTTYCSSVKFFFTIYCTTWFSFRPALADQLKIGFFSLDRATQTEVSEIIDLQEMTNLVQQLLKVCCFASWFLDIHKNIAICSDLIIRARFRIT